MSFSELYQNVIGKGLCARCGICKGICPVQVIGFDEDAYPLLTGDCTECGFCTKCCPGGEVDFARLSETVFGASYSPDTLEGYTENRYVCHPTNHECRLRGASGGIVTALLEYLLEKGKIDGALVVGMNPETPYRTLGVLATTVQEIRDAAQSKYSITPSMEALQQIRKSKGKFAVVGLPCQIHGLRKMAEVDSALSAKLDYILGLYCNCNLNPRGPIEAIEACGISLSDVARFDFRGGGWPGGFFVTRKDGSTIPLHTINIKNVMNVMFRLYGADRCGLCVDALAEYADLSFGDFWTFDYPDKFQELERCTLISQRTPKGLELLREAEKDGAIISHLLPEDRMSKRILQMSQGKKNRAFVRLHKRGLKGEATPQYSFDFPPPTTKAKRSEFFYSLFTLLRGEHTRKMVLKILFSPVGVLLDRINILRKNIFCNYGNN